MRTSRAIASLISSLMLSSGLTAAVLVTPALVGCKDEGQPEYWVEKLDDPSWRARAVTRLVQFYEDTLSRKNNDLKAPEVVELVNKTVEPLTKLYVDQYDNIDSKSRVALIKLLADYRDKRTEPALKKAFDMFVKMPKTSRDETDIKWAARADEDLKLDSLSLPMLEAFRKLRTSSMLGGVAYRDMAEALVAQPPNKALVGPLIEMIKAPAVPPNEKDKSSFDDWKDQIVWQDTAAKVLGKIGDPSATEPLIQVMLDPAKGTTEFTTVQITSVLALVKIGKPAADAAAKLLKSDYEKLQTFQLRRIREVTGSDEKGKPWVQTAAIIIGTIGRQDSIPAMVEAMKNEKDDATKAIIARELTKIPATPESIEAFKETFTSLPLSAELPSGGGAIDSLSEAAGRFCDPSLAPWLVETAGKLKGDADDRKSAQAAMTVTALKLAKAEDLPTVKSAVEKYGTDLEKKLAKQVEAAVGACKDDVSCYIAQMQKPENQKVENQFIGIKSGYMVAILGNEAARDKLIDSLGSISNAGLRFVASQAIDKLSPKGSKAAADKLNTIITNNAKSPDRDKAQGDSSLKEVMFRLYARGG
jgi:HEAT repeat protein